MKILSLSILILLLAGCATVGVAQQRNPATTAATGVVQLENDKISIVGPAAKALYFRLSEKLETIAYTAGCDVNIPGCASRSGKNLTCVSGLTGDSQLNYVCFMEISKASTGEFTSRKIWPPIDEN